MIWCTVAGAKARVRDADGPAGRKPALLLHMAGGGASVWGPVMGLLSRRAPAFAPDFPGHGQSQASALEAQPPFVRPGMGAHLAGLARWTVQLMDGLGLDQVVLVGHSMGAAVALAVALARPDRVAALGVVSAGARISLPPDVRTALAVGGGPWVNGWMDAALPHGTPSSTAHSIRPIFPQTDPEMLRADFLSVDGLDLLAAARQLHMPAVVVAGDQDVLTPLPEARALAAALPRARLTVLTGAGHMLPREQPVAVAAALTSLWDAL